MGSGIALHDAGCDERGELRHDLGHDGLGNCVDVHLRHPRVLEGELGRGTDLGLKRCKRKQKASRKYDRCGLTPKELGVRLRGADDETSVRFES